jgi:hypothetical protein
VVPQTVCENYHPIPGLSITVLASDGGYPITGSPRLRLRLAPRPAKSCGSLISSGE